MNDFQFREDGIYYAHIRVKPGDKQAGGNTVFLCFVYADGCISAQWEPVTTKVDIDTDFMHSCFLWHHDMRKSNVSNPSIARLHSAEAEMLAADLRAPSPLSLRLIPLTADVLTVAVVGPWKSDQITRVHFNDYDSFLKAK